MTVVEELIQHFGLEALPVEGGLFRQTYLSSEMIPKTVLGDRKQGSIVTYDVHSYHVIITNKPDASNATAPPSGRPHISLRETYGFTMTAADDNVLGAVCKLNYLKFITFIKGNSYYSAPPGVFES